MRQAVRQVEQQAVPRTEARYTIRDLLLDCVEDLEAIDFGYLEIAPAEEQKVALTFLETIIDDLERQDIWFPEGDLAIRFFLTDPDRARQYLYGPTDIQDGLGLIDKLKGLLLE